MGEAVFLCRDCGFCGDSPPRVDVCPGCASARVLRHPELASLAIAHVDCDAYYASIEKRDRPELIDQPVIVGGRERGVVTTACYIARRFGVRSAMPMARALQLCPHAVVIKPAMDKYREEARRVAALMREAAPVVESVSIDEAYLDLSEAESRTREPPARSLARLALRIEKRVGITVSIGLAPNKMLAKLASDLGKPRGFAVIGEADARDVIGPMRAGALPGIGPVMARKLEDLGIRTIAELRQANADALIHRFGLWARRLIAYAEGEDPRTVRQSRGRAVSMAAETTFNRDLRQIEDIEAELQRLSGKLAERLTRSDMAAGGLTLKLRWSNRRTITRACRLHAPTQQAEAIWQAARRTLAAEMDGGAFRLVGVTATQLLPGRQADPPDLFFGLSAAR